MLIFKFNFSSVKQLDITKSFGMFFQNTLMSQFLILTLGIWIIWSFQMSFELSAIKSFQVVVF